MPFVIYALPRSRTNWLSRYLSTEGWHCGHDVMPRMRGLDDLKSWLSQDASGSVETAAAPFWRLIHKVRPDLRTVVIRRPAAEVVDSIMRQNIGYEREALTRTINRLDAALDRIESRVPGVLRVDYDRIDAACQRLCEHVGVPWDILHWRRMAATHIHGSLLADTRYVLAHRTQLERIAKMARHRIIADMRAGRVPPDGVTFQQESFDDVLRDGHHLFEEHYCQVGQSPDTIDTKLNLPLMRAVYERGCMQLTTARCNGKMFGYLITVFGPKMEYVGESEALNAAFFVSADMPGIGLRLQRASADALVQKGIDTLYMRAGIVGTGPKMGAIARRMGAYSYGEMYRLDLQGD